jgi:transposase-like protein
MVASVICCPSCQQAGPVVKHGTNRGGTARLRCKDCRKTFTPHPNPRRVTEETESQILAALAERLSISAVARLLKVGRQTVYDTLKKSVGPGASDSPPARECV